MFDFFQRRRSKQEVRNTKMFISKRQILFFVCGLAISFYVYMSSSKYSQTIQRDQFTKPRPYIDDFTKIQTTKEKVSSTFSPETTITKSSKKWLIDLPKCKIPDIDPRKAINDLFVSNETEIIELNNKRVNCAAMYRNITSVSADGKLLIVQTEPNDLIEYCCYRSVHRADPGKDVARDDFIKLEYSFNLLIVNHRPVNKMGKGPRVLYKNTGSVEPFLGMIGRYSILSSWRLGKECLKIKAKSTKVSEEFIKVECYNKSLSHDPLYKNFHAMYIDKVAKYDRSNQKNENSYDKYNVLVLGVDSISRLNMHRQMPGMIRYLKNELNAIEMQGYLGIGDDTFYNVAPMTSGLPAADLDRCYSKVHFYDKCNLIWKHYSVAGYKTLLAEDTAQISEFNYVKYGFNNTPVDYYLRPAIMAAEEEIGHEESTNTKFCVGPVTATQFVLDYVRQTFLASTRKKDKIFGFSWISSLTHDEIDLVTQADSIYLDFFKSMRKSKILDQTIVFFLSDHGMRWGDIVETDDGKLEERLPFNFVIFPESFRSNYPQIVNTVQHNSKRMTSAFDIFATLTNLISFSGKPMNSSTWYKSPEEAKRSKSLFSRIPSDRTCADMSVQPLWCPCENKDDEESLEMTYTIELETTPGGGIFEAAIQGTPEGKHLQIMDEIVRNNLYGNQSHCVKSKYLKLFCFCKGTPEVIH